jgi:hypothetical protein
MFPDKKPLASELMSAPSRSLSLFHYTVTYSITSKKTIRHCRLAGLKVGSRRIHVIFHPSRVTAKIYAGMLHVSTSKLRHPLPLVYFSLALSSLS